ncbi:unnamed protein product [Tilletia controversa]|nr:unnamed protein product [Tilletia controversa]
MTPSSRLTLSEFVSATCVLLDAMRSIANDVTDPTSRRLLNIEADIWSTQFNLIFKHFLRRESEINWPVLVEYCQTMRRCVSVHHSTRGPRDTVVSQVLCSLVKLLRCGLVVLCLQGQDIRFARSPAVRMP